MSARITAAEATTILRDLARGREDGNGRDVWPLYDRAEDAMAAVVALDDELATAQSHATHALDDAATLRARAEAAEAEVARLRAGSDVLIAERDDARLMSRCNHDNWRSALSDVDALRATTEGRAAPTEAEVRAHAATGGRWRARLSHGGIYTARYPDAAILDHDGALWWAIDRDDNNCPWPTGAAEAATALAGEGR